LFDKLTEIVEVVDIGHGQSAFNIDKGVISVKMGSDGILEYYKLNGG